MSLYMFNKTKQKEKSEKKKRKLKENPIDGNLRISLHKSKRVGGLDTRPERVFVTDLSAWLRLPVGLEREHTLDSSMFVTNGTGM